MDSTETGKNKRLMQADGFWRDTLILALFVCGFHLICNFAFLVEDDRPPHFDTSNHFQISIKQFHVLSETPLNREGLSALPSRLNRINQYYPPLFYLFASPFYAINGVSFTAARASNTFFLFLLIFSIYGIGVRLYNRATGLLAAAVISLYPIVFGLSRDYYPDLALLAWMSATVYCLLSTDGFRRTGMTLLFGIAYGLGQLTKQPFTFFAIGPCLYVFLDSIRPYPEFLRAIAAPVRVAAMRWSVPGLLALAGFLGWDAWSLWRQSHGGVLATFRLILEILLCLAALAGFIFMLRKGWSELNEEPPVKQRFLTTWKQVGHVVLAGIIAISIAGPFYAANWEFIRSEGRFVVEQAGIDRGMAPASQTLLEYAADIPRMQIHPFFTALALLGLVLYPRKHARQKLFLVVSFIVAYAIMSSLRTKDPRYTMPYLYALAPLSVAWIFELRSLAQRWAAICLILIAGGIQFLVISFGGGYPRGAGETFLTSWIRPSPYGSSQTNLSNWRNRDIVQDISTFGSPAPDTPIRTTLLCNAGFLQYASLQCEALRQNLPLEFNMPKSEIQHDYTRRLYELTLSQFIITKTGDQGPEFTLRSSTDLRDELNDPDSCLRTRFSLLKCYELPDSSQARLWIRNDRWLSPPPPRSAMPLIALDYGQGRILHGVTVEPPAAALGALASVYIAWASPVVDLGDANLYLQFRDESGNPAYSEQVNIHQGMTLPLADTKNLCLARYPVYLNPQSQAGPGKYNMVLLLMIPSRGEILIPVYRVRPERPFEGKPEPELDPVRLTFEPVAPGILKPVAHTAATLPPDYADFAIPEAAPDGVIRLGTIEVLPERSVYPMTCDDLFKQLEHLEI